jgi:long-chain acyl-CoA synthetase
VSSVAAPALAPVDSPEGAPRTLPGWLLEQARIRPRATAIRVKDLGRWQETSWAEYAERVAGVGRALAHMGVGPGDRVAVVSGNRAEWIVTDLAVQGIGATTVTVSVTGPPEQLAEQLASTSAGVVIVEDEEQFDKVMESRDRLTLRHVIVIDPRGIRRLEDPASSFEALEALGSADAVRARGGDLDSWRTSVASLDPGSIATIVFTSGATGQPKGALLTHDALTTAASSGAEALGLRAGDEIVSTLPLSDISERTLTVAQAVHIGAVVNFGEGGVSLGNDLREVQPTVLLGSPRVWERLRESVEAGARGAGIVKRRAMRAAQGSGGGFKNLVVRRPLRKNLGLARTRVAISATSPCAVELVDYWRSLGVRLRQAYSLTEAAGFAAVASPTDPAGSVGHTGAGVEVELDPAGEILLRSPAAFAGLLGDAGGGALQAGGWFHTGDLGEMDDGVLSITGRAKDVVITSAGHRTAPRAIEARLEESPYVRAAVIVGDGRPCLGALIVIEATSVGDWAAERGASFTTYATLGALPEVFELVDGVVEGVNAELDERGRIGCVAILPQDLADDEELVTATHKLRRDPIAARFADVVDRMYAERNRGSAS